MGELIVFKHEDISEFTKGFSEERALGNPGAFGQVYRGRIKGEKFPNCPAKVAIKISEEKNDHMRRMWEDGTVKVADFGLATKRGDIMTHFNDKRNGVFNPSDTEEAKEKFDVYCFGMVMRQLVLKEKDRWSPTKCSGLLLSDRCIKWEPNERPSMDETVSAIKNIQKEQSEAESSTKRKKK